jgi:nitric oxide reductase NorQ protein
MVDESNVKSYVAKGLDTKINIKLSFTPRVTAPTLKAKYDIGKYDLRGSYNPDPSILTLIPKNTPEYVEHGEHYVERIMRALFYFKQCALIGPSGTGKSIPGNQPVQVILNGKHENVVFDRLFSILENSGSQVVSDNGWEMIFVKDAQLLVLSYDKITERIHWRVPAAIARTLHDGDIAMLTTASGKVLAATPDHSFIAMNGLLKASDLKPGIHIPVMEDVPLPYVVATIGSQAKSQCSTDAKWDKIVDVRKERYRGWVYDFHVPGTETFVAGSGVVTHNTHVVYLVAELAGLPLWEINCGLQTSVYDLFGRFVGLGKENWVDGQITSWLRKGGILYLDEANMMKQDVATRLNPVLDTRGHLVLNEKDNEIIPRHPNGYVIISMNPYSAEFAGTKPLNAAFRRRMSVWIYFDYMSVGEKIAQDEVDLIARKANIAASAAEKMVRVAAEMRRLYKSGDLPYAPSVGDLINWGRLVYDGIDVATAAEETVIAVTSDDLEVQSNIRRIVQRVCGEGIETLQ